MEISSTVSFEVGHAGRTAISRLRCEPPLVLRETTSGVMMIGAAAGPLGGDRWSLRVGADRAAHARIGSIAATIAQRGLNTAESRFEISVDLQSEATLDWAPEPLVVAEGAVHRVRIDIDLAASSRLYWRDIVVLGRHAQPPGRAITRSRIRRAGRPLFAHDLDIGAGAAVGWDGPAVLAGARVIGNLLIVDPSLSPAPDICPSPSLEAATIFRLAGPAVLVVARGQTTCEVTAALDKARAELGLLIVT